MGTHTRETNILYLIPISRNFSCLEVQDLNTENKASWNIFFPISRIFREILLISRNFREIITYLFTCTWGLNKPNDLPDLIRFLKYFFRGVQAVQQEFTIPGQASFESQSTFWPENIQDNIFWHVPAHPTIEQMSKWVN